MRTPANGSLVRAALSAIARAQNMSALARVAGLDRSGLYKALSEDGNPSLATIIKIVRALGLKLRIVPAGYRGRRGRRTTSPQVHNHSCAAE